VRGGEGRGEGGRRGEERRGEGGEEGVEDKEGGWGEGSGEEQEGRGKVEWREGGTTGGFCLRTPVVPLRQHTYQIGFRRATQQALILHSFTRAYAYPHCLLVPPREDGCLESELEELLQPHEVAAVAAVGPGGAPAFVLQVGSSTAA